MKNVHRTAFKKTKKGLKVFSLSTGSSRVLPDECQGCFSTKPSLVRVGLPELLERIGDVFPTCAVLYPTTDQANLSADFPGELCTTVGPVLTAT